VSHQPLSNIKVAVLGGGAFSLALANALSHNKVPCSLLVRNASVADHINTHHIHPKYLSDFILPDTISATTLPSIALADAKFIIHAVPMQESRAFLANIKPHLSPDIPILSVSKGIEQNTCKLMNDVLSETLGPHHPTAFLSGPSFAQEIMKGEPTAVVIASKNIALANEMGKILSSDVFRCHTTTDVIGVELGGAVKNVIAIAAGMCEGLGFGMNSVSSLITKGCMEMANMGAMMGAQYETFMGLSGVGDTFGTCLGALSRNRRVGYRLAKGDNLSTILKGLDGVSEGITTVAALEKLISKKVRASSIELKFPILTGVARIINGQMSPQMGVNMLMHYPIRDETRRMPASQEHSSS
jgi:glycerol-3-phosphate dehydrogenase (NAD+)